MTFKEALAKGIIEDLPDKEYHAIEAIGSSPMKMFHDCPAKAFSPIEVTDDMNLGAGQDAYSLVSPEHFHKLFAVPPDFGDLRNPKNKESAVNWSLENGGKIMLPATVTSKKIPTMKAIEDVDHYLFHEHPMTKRILRTGSQQVSMFWKDEETGLACKGRIDHLPDPQYRIIFDLKKCARIERFVYQMEELRYFLQAGHYSVGAEMNNQDVDAFSFLAFNFGDPPQVRIVTYDDSDDDRLTKLKNLSKVTLRLINECRQADCFPRYPIPFETQSMAGILGLKSKIAQQLTPFMMSETAPIPRCLFGLL